MNKFLKIALIVIGVIVAIILVLGLVMPKKFDVSRTVTIDAPKEFVFQNVNSLEKMDKWSPWSKLDPKMHVESIGSEGTVGRIRKWKGNKKVGEGEQEMKEIIPNELKWNTPKEKAVPNDIKILWIDGVDGYRYVGNIEFDEKEILPAFKEISSGDHKAKIELKITVNIPKTSASVKLVKGDQQVWLKNSKIMVRKTKYKD